MKRLLANKLRGKATYATSTADIGGFAQQDAKLPKKMKGDMVPVCVALGMIAVSTSLGIYTALHELKDSPQVRVNKKRRETLPEVVEPDRVLNEADNFISHSLFRKVAHVHVKDKLLDDHDPTRGRGDHMLAHNHKILKAETLESVGVNPRVN